MKILFQCYSSDENGILNREKTGGKRKKTAQKQAKISFVSFGVTTARNLSKTLWSFFIKLIELC